MGLDPRLEVSHLADRCRRGAAPSPRARPRPTPARFTPRDGGNGIAYIFSMTTSPCGAVAVGVPSKRMRTLSTTPLKPKRLLGNLGGGLGSKGASGSPMK